MTHIGTVNAFHTLLPKANTGGRSKLHLSQIRPFCVFWNSGCLSCFW